MKCAGKGKKWRVSVSTGKNNGNIAVRVNLVARRYKAFYL